MKPIRLASPELGSEEATAIARVLGSGMLVQGAEVSAFEAEVAARCGRAYGVAVSSGTAALELALRALGITSGEVLVPDLTWPSPAHAAVLVGATPVLVDVDPDEWNGTPEAFAQGRSASTRAALVIDQFGVPARHEAIAAALGDLPIVEDAACGIGSAQDGRPCGSFGVVSCLSFHPRKVITTGEGGMCLTDDPRLADELRTLRNHGQRAPGQFAFAGANLRMTEIQAAMGRVQLGRLDGIVAQRRELADAYRASLPASVSTQALPTSATRNEQTFGVLLPEGIDRDAVIGALREGGIESGRLSYALHTLPSLGSARVAGSTSVTDAIVRRGLALPLHGGMDASDVARVCAALGRTLETLR